MFAAGYSWRGQTQLYCIPEKSKMNGELFIKQVLSLIVKEDIPRLYGSDAPEVVIHMDSATSHTWSSGWKIIM